MSKIVSSIEVNANASPPPQHSVSEGALLGRTVTRSFSGEEKEVCNRITSFVNSEQHPVSTPLDSSGKFDSLKEKLIAQGIPNETAEKISNWYKSNFDLILNGSSDSKNGVNTQIETFKVYRDPASLALIGEIGLRDLNHGSVKALKETLKITNGVDISEGLRFKALSHDKEDLDRFSQDIQVELAVRKELGDIPHLLSISAVKYGSKDGKEKERYVPEKCDGSIYNLIFDPDSKDVIPLDASSRLSEQALDCSYDALEALVAIHQKGYVHRDIKLENILFKGNQGVLCDLGFCSKATDGLKKCGSSGYIAPELFSNQPNGDPKKADVFSFGMVLLSIVDPDLSIELQLLQRDLLDKSLRLGPYRAQLRLEVAQMSKGDSLKQLIAACLQVDSEKRPTSEQVLQQLGVCRNQQKPK